MSKRAHDTEINWENEIAQVAKGYLDGDAEVTRRRALWPAAVRDVLLPTLKEAGDIFAKHMGTVAKDAIGSIRAEHAIIGGGPRRDPDGPKIEAVQLYLCNSDGLGFLPHSGTLVVEVGATLGYSLGVSGRVLRWHIDHRLTGYSDDSGQMTEDEYFEDASKLTVDLVRLHVVKFLRHALTTSYRGDQSSSPVGFSLRHRVP
jgi:hypothetical protein